MAVVNGALGVFLLDLHMSSVHYDYRIQVENIQVTSSLFTVLQRWHTSFFYDTAATFKFLKLYCVISCYSLPNNCHRLCCELYEVLSRRSPLCMCAFCNANENYYVLFRPPMCEENTECAYVYAYQAVG